MHVDLAWGRQHRDLEIEDRMVLVGQRPDQVPRITDPTMAVREALENPVDFPPLRRALIPDDHVAIAVDEDLDQLPALLIPLLEHIVQAGISPAAMTLICQPPSTGQPWLEVLPDDFQEVHVEIHDPTERRKLSYLATTRRGRRIYLNRTAVDADQLILLTRRHYDSFQGYGGGVEDLFPQLSDEATRQEAAGKLSFDAPGKRQWPMHQEALEVAWHLGTPFLVQVIEGTDNEVAGVLAGPVESNQAGEKLLDERWHIEVEQAPDVVVACMGGDPAKHTFTDLARALACAARVVKSQGRIVLLSEAGPVLGPCAQILRNTEDLGRALHLMAEEKPPDWEGGFLWANAAQRAKLFLFSKIEDEVVEEMFVTPLEKPEQVKRVLEGARTCLFLPDAHKAMAVVSKV